MWSWLARRCARRRGVEGARRCPALALVAVAGACDPQVTIGHYDMEAGLAGGASQGDGAAAPLRWSADHDDGTLDEWIADGNGYTYVEADASIGPTTERSRSGQGALLASCNPIDGGLAQAVIAREAAVAEARYGAYYFFPGAPDTDYFVVMKLSTGDGADRFDIDIHAPFGSTPRLRLFEHGSDWITEPASAPLPIGQWVHIVATLRTSNGEDGFLSVAQDGVTVLEVGPRPTISGERVTWFVGAACRSVSPAPYSFYVDDASIQAL